MHKEFLMGDNIYLLHYIMSQRKRILCYIPSKLKSTLNDNYIPSGNWHRDKCIYGILVKHYITFPAKYSIAENDPEIKNVITYFEKNEVDQIGFTLGDFDFKHLKHVSEINFRSIKQQSALALCSMAVYIKTRKVKSYQIDSDMKIIFKN